MKIAVASRSFSKNNLLRAELESQYPDAEIVYNDNDKVLSGDELVSFLANATHAITGLEIIDEPLLKACPKLKKISKYGVGLDMIDIDALKKHGVHLGHSDGVNKRSVSELTLGFMLLLMRNMHVSNKNLVQQKWIRAPGALLSKKTIGIIGCGNIGKDLVHLLKPFDCTLLVHDIVDYSDFYQKYGLQKVTFKELLKQSDIVTVHVPKTKQTINLISDQEFETMKPSSFLINTARGEIIDENALLNALNENKILAAAADVFTIEPPVDFKLIQHPRFYGTPHIGGNADEAILAMGKAAIQNIED